MNDCLLILSCHADSEEKKDTVLKKIEILKKIGISICVSTHCGLYLTELSTHSDYVLYDHNNEQIFLEDYLENVDVIGSGKKYGSNTGSMKHGNPHSPICIETSYPSAFHTKPVLSILRNGIILSKFNNYKWTIYMEYDFDEPVCGYKEFIHDVIEELEKQEKKCLYIRKKYDTFSLLWGQFIIFETETFFNYSRFFSGDWQDSKRNFIREWGMNFGESIVLQSITEAYGPNNVIEKDIDEIANRYWEGKQIKYSNKYNSNSYLDPELSRLKIMLLPEKNSSWSSIKLRLYVYNSNSFNVILDNISLSGGGKVLFNSNDFSINADTWTVIPIDHETDLAEIKRLDFFVTYKKVRIINLTYYTDFLDIIHDNIMKISTGWNI